MVEDKRKREKIRQPSHISFLHYLLICHSNGIKLKDWRRKHILTIFFILNLHSQNIFFIFKYEVNNRNNLYKKYIINSDLK